MKTIVIFLATLLLSLATWSQVKVSGVVTDSATGETLPGATVMYEEGMGAVTDIDGKYELTLSSGTYLLKVNYVGMDEKTAEIIVDKYPIYLNFELTGMTLQEMNVVADVAVGRKTPVAFSDISSIKIKEELGTRDLPLILNSTPGVYATQAGGGDGDARINIRGFNQRNVSVMVDGIPMNDMENGWVYWSNWFGLDAVTQKIQVQRGLGASKLAVPAIGGNINILSKGIDDDFGVTLSSEMGNNQNLRQGFGFNSGRLKGGWGVTSAFSYKTNDGWVTQLGSRQLFYFLKITKQVEDHSFTFSIMGSPQYHQQRLGLQRLSYYDTDYALAHGEDTTNAAATQLELNRGLKFNSEWGYLKRDRYDPNAPEKAESARTNYYHKPIVNLKHFWTPNHRWALSNVLYASFGKGGGARPNVSKTDPETGLTDYQYMYDKNTKGFTNFLGVELFPYDLNQVNDKSYYKSSYYLQSNVNSHRWYGILSTFKFRYNENLEFSGGFDGRYYHTDRYQVVYDLLGGDYVVVDQTVQNQNILTEQKEANVVRYENDRINYDITSYVKQYGVFLLAEYSKPKYSAFINGTLSANEYNRVDHFALHDQEGNEKASGWQKFKGATIKGGFKYLIDSKQNVFVNAGYLSRAQNMANSYSGNTLNLYNDLANEKISSIELGYMYSTKKLKPSINAYYTIWKNRPHTGTKKDGTENVYYNVPGMSALHKGIEFEIEYTPIKSVTIEGVASVGDWRWTSANKAYITNENGTAVIDSVQFDARGIKVGDAAQTQGSFAIRYAPFKGFYIKPRITYFDNNFSEFDPDALTGENGGKQSWQMPAYYMIDLGAGYTYSPSKKYSLRLSMNVMNLTDLIYITDATNNQYGSGFDAKSAGVFYGQGLRWTAGLTLTFK